MECDELDDKDVMNSSAVNSIVLDYYKKFGRKRDLEQFFSLSTAQGELRNPTGTFWRNMKVQNDSSDSGGKQSESSQELCRISIKCSVHDPSSSQDENAKSKSEPVSPPIITEDYVQDISRPTSRYTDDGSDKSGDENLQKSFDVVLDTSMNKPISPSSSVTSQRKLEWDSLADVGYANESEKKTSASSLSTLERLALQQQYSNNDTRQNLGFPTAHSTPLDESQSASKSKRLVGKKSTKINKNDIDSVELNTPQNCENKHSQCINVHLTKHISFSVGKSGELVVENIKNNLDVPQKVPTNTATISHVNTEKEIQTTLKTNKENSTITHAHYTQKTPVLMSVNTLKKKNRRRKLRMAQKKARNKKKQSTQKESINLQEKSGEQVSEAESFEYLPGHMYNQNNLKLDHPLPKKVVSNKSSLESSGVLTTDSSNGTKHSFTKDLEKSVELLKGALQNRYDDNLKNKLVKEIIQRLLKSKYRDDDSTTDFLSGLSFGSKKLGLQHSSSTSTHTGSDGNDTIEKKKIAKPKKSILRMDKFNANAIASTSQSTPNLLTATHTEKPVDSKNIKHLTSSNTDSDISSKVKLSAHTRTSSEELYRKYLDAVRREEAYRKHLKDKEIFLKQKLTNSDSALKIPKKPDDHISRQFQDLMNDLVRNNHDNGSGDAGKLEGSSDSNTNYERLNVKSQRNHSVYTLSSCNSCSQSKKPNLKKRIQTDLQYLSEPGTSREHMHYCCCPHHSMNNKFGVTDSSVQVNIKQLDPLKEHVSKPRKCLKCDEQQHTKPVFSDYVTSDIKYVCLCSEKVLSQDICDNYLVYKCARLSDKGIQSSEITEIQSKPVNLQSKNKCTCKHIDTESQTLIPNLDISLNKKPFSVENINSDSEQLKKASKSSQTNLNLLGEKSNDKSEASSASDLNKDLISCTTGMELKDYKVLVHEATRCIQTEISINPQISNPSLPDVHIINDTDSVKIINEQVKEVSKCSSTNMCSNKDRKDNETNSKNVEIAEESIDVAYKKEIQNEVIDKLFGERANNNFQLDNNRMDDADVTENFTIPIQGTNMKLMVSIGSNDQKKSAPLKKNCMQTKPSLAEKSDISQESTSVGEESCNSVQYYKHTNKKLNSDTNNSQHDVDYSNNNNIKYSKVQFQKLDKSCCNNSNALKFNTYPMNENKSFMRSNIETNNLVAYTQTNDIQKKDIMTQKTDTLTKIDNEITNKLYASQIPEYSIDVDETKNKLTTAETPKESITRDIEIQSNIPQTMLPIDSNDNMHNYVNKQYTGTKCAGSCNVQVEEPAILSQPSQLIDHSELSSKAQSGNSSGMDTDTTERSKSSNDKIEKSLSEIPISKEERYSETEDPILDIIKDITKRYSKDNIEKHKRKKCFKEIVTVLNYLLDTDDSTDHDQVKIMHSCISDNHIKSKLDKPVAKISESSQTIDKVDKGVQMSAKKSKNRLHNTESSDLVTSTDLPSTSSDSATCKVLNKIKKECERFHQKRCKSNGCGKKCDASSSTSANCNQCSKIHHCSCRLHKCKAHKAKPRVEEAQKKSVAYNLIIQTSESMISEETVFENNRRPLRNIIVRVPSRRNDGFIPFKELETKIERKMSQCSPRCDRKSQRSKSCPNEYEIDADNSARHPQECTVREYLEINRPDFIQKSVQRQDCLKVINNSSDKDPCSPHLKMVVVHTPNCMGSVANCNMYCGGVPITYNPCYDPCTQTIQNEVTRIANERAVGRELLSSHVDRESPLSALNIEELRQLARDIGISLSPKKRTPKFLSERDMKKHSEKIYKSLPEVKQKKEEVRKENIKKANLLMANIFKKNLQKKTLRGSVNLSNYSTVVKI